MRFAGCTLDLDARRLFRGTREIHLSPKAFDVLRVLVESRPRAVAKAELLERVWRGVYVSESSLARTINEIREAAGDHARAGRIVRTVHGYGYAFGAEVEDAGTTSVTGRRRSAATCRLVSADLEITLREGDQVSGRDPACDIWLDSARVSRRHSRFVVKGSSVVVEDLASKNGTFVNAHRIEGRVELRMGDRIRIGPFTFVFHVGVAAPSTETEIGVMFRMRPPKPASRP